MPSGALGSQSRAVGIVKHCAAAMVAEAERRKRICILREGGRASGELVISVCEMLQVRGHDLLPTI
jgi:hypothetical protein